MVDYRYRHEAMKWYPYSFYPPEGPWLIVNPENWLIDIENWCEDQFGPQLGFDRWRRDIWTFRFKFVADAMAFRLRWCTGSSGGA